MASATRTRGARATGQTQGQKGQKQHGISPEAVPGYISKTRLCNFYLSGCCARGGLCTFAHGKHELKAKPDFSRTQLCTMGSSCEDKRCAFAHEASELRILVPEDLSSLKQARTSNKRFSTATKQGRMPAVPHGTRPLFAPLQDPAPLACEQVSRSERAAVDFALPMKVFREELLSFQSSWEESTWDGSQSSRSDDFEPCNVQVPLMGWSL